MTEKGQEFGREEVKLALKNPGMHLEGMHYPTTPIGVHYLLIHFDVPLIDPADYELWFSRTPPTGTIRGRPAVGGG